MGKKRGKKKRKEAEIKRRKKMIIGDG